MLKKFLLVFSTIALTCFTSIAQEDVYQLNELSLNDMGGFKQPPSNWMVTGNLTATYTDTVFKAAAGKGVLLDQYTKLIQFKPGTNIFTAFEHGDLYLELDFMMPKGSNSGIYFQSRYEIQLYDSWGVKNPRYFDCGAIYQRWDDKRPGEEKGYEGHPPLKNACFAPGLWQHLQVLFEAPKFDASGKKISPARFRKVILNGVVIHQNIVVTGPTRAAAFEDEKALGPLMIQGDHGMVAFRNIKYASLADWHADWKSLSYEYFEGKFPDSAAFQKAKPVRTGQATSIDSRLADAKDNFALTFNGKFTVPEDNDYIFYMRTTGVGYLRIDGKSVIAPQWTWIRGDLLQGKIHLTAGDHELKTGCIKEVNWAEPGLAIFVSKPNSKTIGLHSLASLPPIPHAPLIDVEATKEPELVRSFYMQGDKKLTHVISVGEPVGTHYTYDLKKGGLIAIWKGDFLNTTDMWFERGEPQTASPLGAAILMTKYLSAVIEKDSPADSLTEWKYAGYRLNDHRSPVFNYRLRDAEVSDSISIWQDGKGLSRTIKINGNTGLKKPVIALAQANEISQLGNGLYAINNQQYYIQTDPKAVTSITAGPNNTQILIAENSVQYQLIW